MRAVSARGWFVAGLMAIGLAAGLAMSDGPAQAASYPDHPVKIVVPFPAGGTADAVPRIVAEWLSRKWGQPVVIENHAGAGGNIGAELVYKAAPDGYMLLSAPPPPLVVNQNLYPNLGFDPGKFEPIIVMAQVPNSLLVNPDKIKAKSLDEFIDDLKRHPDTVTAATQGNGTTSHLTTELFNLKAGVKLRPVPYRGSAPALQGLLAGNVDMMFDNLGVSLALVKAGKLRLLAVASAQRMPSLPDAPALAEKLPGFESVAWYAIVAPPGTPKAIVDKINADVNEALRDASVRERLTKLSAEIYGGSVDKAAEYMHEEVERWGSVIKAAHITMK
ncbi:MAG TPA: tripartite tricarboxylate transporter substrate binding protein [Pseudolabrys sp.]|nr:tripartite tricarboxylate transporter substrate binding protein [Pseudolabrys sp.]